MSIIIRLQRLPWSASAADVREFFRGLSIPEGGVHIVGGRDGDAFIAFAADEDARLAMRNDGKRLKDSKIKLYLSSRQEMQKVIEKARSEYAASTHHNNNSNDTDDDDYSSHSRRSKHRSRSGSRERVARSRSPERSRDSLNSSHSQLPQKPSAPISGFSSFPVHPNVADNSYIAAPSSATQFKPGPNFLDRNQPPPPGPQSSMENPMNLNKNPPFPTSQIPPVLLNEMAFSGGPGTDFDARGGGPSYAPIPSQPAPFRNRRAALLPEPDEMGLVDDPSFYRNSNNGGAVLDRFQPPPMDTRNFLPPPPMPPQFPNEPPAPFYPPREAMEPYYGPPQMMDAYSEPNYDPGYGGSRAEDTMDYHAGGKAICVDNAPMNILRYGDIREFFHPMRLDGPDSIKIIVDDRGEKTGRVYCRFSMATDAEAALRLDRRSGVRIRPCTDDEYNSAYDGCRSSNSGPNDSYNYNSRYDNNNYDNNGRGIEERRSSYRERNQRTNSQPWDVTNGRYIVEITNIPYRNSDPTIWDVVAHLRPVELRRKMKQRDVHLLQSDTAFVEFNNQSDADAALELNGFKLGGRPINFRKSCVAYMEEEQTRSYNPNVRRSPSFSSDRRRDYNRDDRDYNRDDREYNRDERDYNKDERGERDSRDRDSRDERRTSTSSDSRRTRDYESRGDRNSDRGGDKEKSSSEEKKDRTREKEKEKETVSAEKQQPTTQPLPLDKHTCLLMSNLPPTIQVKDIQSFFQGLRVAPGGIRLMKEPRGSAYVEFCSFRDCEQAMTKNRQYIGVQVVSLRPCSKSELTEAVQKQHGIGAGPSKNSTPDVPKPGENQQQRASSSTSVATNQPKQQQKQPVQNMQQNLNYNPKNNNAGRVSAQQQQTPHVTSSVGTGDVTDQSESTETNSYLPDIDSSIVGDLGLSGFVCFLHNLPSKITLEEICGLFQSEHMIDDTVRMHYSSTTGEPTGDCLLAFATLLDAEKACARVSGQIIFGRQLKMSVIRQM